MYERLLQQSHSVSPYLPFHAIYIVGWGFLVTMFIEKKLRLKKDLKRKKLRLKLKQKEKLQEKFDQKIKRKQRNQNKRKNLNLEEESNF